MLETQLQSSESLYTTMGADGVSRTIDREALENRLSKLYMYLERANGTPFAPRGRVKGLW